MNKNLIIGIIAAVVIIGGVATYMVSSNNNKINSTQEMSDKMMQGDSMTEKAIENAQNGEQRMETEKDKMKSDVTMDSGAIGGNELMQQQAGSYKDYSAAQVEAEQKAGNKVVLFFHAPWCPQCKTADSAFKANLDKIPKGVALLKTDYDSSKDLKAKYGVTYQHTFVQIDNDENQVTKWISGDVDLLIKSIK